MTIMIFLLVIGIAYGCSTIPNCLQCVSTSTCSICSDGYYLESGQCISCSFILNCQSCSSGSFCSVCSSGYYLSDGSCYPCVGLSNCASCSMDGECTECINDSYLSEGECVSCSSLAHCSTCSSTGICETCSINYFPDESGDCVTCASVNCNICDSSTGACSDCYEDYFISGGTCMPCSDIDNCKDCSSDGNCMLCYDGFEEVNGICEECLSFLTETRCTICAADVRGTGLIFMHCAAFLMLFVYALNYDSYSELGDESPTNVSCCQQFVKFHTILGKRKSRIEWVALVSTNFFLLVMLNGLVLFLATDFLANHSLSFQDLFWYIFIAVFNGFICALSVFSIELLLGRPRNASWLIMLIVNVISLLFTCAMSLASCHEWNEIWFVVYCISTAFDWIAIKSIISLVKMKKVKF